VGFSVDVSTHVWAQGRSLAVPAAWFTEAVPYPTFACVKSSPLSRIADAALPPREVAGDSPLIRCGPTKKSCIDNFRLFFALSNISLLGCHQKGRR